MKQLFFLASLLILSICNVYAQDINAEKAIVSQDKIRLDKREISISNENLTSYLTSPDCRNHATIQRIPTENEKESIFNITVFDSDYNQKLWSKKFNAKNERYVLTDKIVLKINGDKISGLNTRDGKEIWKIKQFVYLGSKNDLAICLNANAAELAAFSLVAGSEVWSTPIDVENGLSLEQIIDKNKSYLVTSGLQSINWKNGEVKKLKSKACVSTKAAIATKIALGALFVLSEAYMSSTDFGGHYIYTCPYKLSFQQ